MKIVEFINDFKNKKIMNTKTDVTIVPTYIKKILEVKDYVPFADKRALCAQVLNACNTVDADSGLVKVDSVKRYIIFTITILSTYTNLEFSADEDSEFDSLDEYDMLCQNDLLNPILDVIGAEYISCNNILNMMMADITANNNTVENVLSVATKKALDIVDGFANVLSDKVKELNLDFNQIDINKYKWLIEVLAKK